MTVYFYSGRNSFGGATYILSHIVELLNKAGTEAYFHGEHPWFVGLSPYNRIGWPKLTPEDSLVCHMYAPPEKPNVKKAVIALHEKTFPYKAYVSVCKNCGAESPTQPAVFRMLRGKKTILEATCSKCYKRAVSPVPGQLHQFSHVVFSSEAHKEKSMRLQPCWGDSVSIIPNPVDVPFTWEPPEEPTAGIIGALVARKQVHVSIRKAQEAGFKRILIYGPKEEDFYDQHISPLVKGGVKLMGESKDRQKMYNSISEVFHYSKWEQACMVQGECKKLGIPFHCDEEVTPPWDLATDEEIVKMWQDLLLS